MGMTPLAGLMMGTRCGDLDPSVVNYLKYTLNITGHELDEILNKKSGLLGISGVDADAQPIHVVADFCAGNGIVLADAAGKDDGIHAEKNKHPVGDVCEITAWGAKVRTLVIATDEELMIARDTKEVIEEK